jgi:alanine or glycine:cation symporter, AGCS family
VTVFAFIVVHPFLLAAPRLVTVWEFADTLNGLMAAPNLIALIALAGVVVREKVALFAARD